MNLGKLMLSQIQIITISRPKKKAGRKEEQALDPYLYENALT